MKTLSEIRFQISRIKKLNRELVIYSMNKMIKPNRDLVKSEIQERDKREF